MDQKSINTAPKGQFLKVMLVVVIVGLGLAMGSFYLLRVTKQNRRQADRVIGEQHSTFVAVLPKNLHPNISTTRFNCRNPGTPPMYLEDNYCSRDSAIKVFAPTKQAAELKQKINNYQVGQIKTGWQKTKDKAGKLDLNLEKRGFNAAAGVICKLALRDVTPDYQAKGIEYQLTISCGWLT